MRSRLLLAITAACALALGGCGDTLQVRPISHHVLEGLIAAPYPVYWLGDSFRGLRISEATHDPSGAYTVQYGNCLEGGQGTCTPPLRIVTSPDNSFMPGSTVAHRSHSVRGVGASALEAGRTLVIATGPVVVSIYASGPSLANAAAQAAVPINVPASPGEALPVRAPETGFASAPLPSQLPANVRPPG